MLDAKHIPYLRRSHTLWIKNTRTVIEFGRTAPLGNNAETVSVSDTVY